jgi:hypothetical protein
MGDDGWRRDYEKWRRARLRRVQASARVWLGVLTTLLGLLGSVVLFKGGSLVTGITANLYWQVILIVLVSLVFATAVLAVIAGGVATWGGLKDILPLAPMPPAKESNDQVAQPAASPTEEAGVPKASRSLRVLLKRVLRACRRLFIRLVLWFGSGNVDDRKQALKVFEDEEEEGADPWQKYMGDIVDNADRNRIYLHASRVLGVAAAVFIAVLAIVAIVAGTVAPAPSDVVVVYHGQFRCVPVGDYAKYTGVTQVISVSSC